VSIAIKIRKGEGLVWGTLKWAARRALHFHVPVGASTKPLFDLLYRSHVFARESLTWALRFFWYEPLFRSQCYAVGSEFEMETLPYLVGSGRIVIGERVQLSGKPAFGFNNRQHDAPELLIGDDTFIGHDCSFSVGRSVRVGRHCLLATGVRVQDFDGHPLDADQRRANIPTPPEGMRPVVIGDDVWIGTCALILKGVTIGDRSIIGAGAVVTRDVPPDVIVAGNPARVVKELASPEGYQRGRLPAAGRSEEGGSRC
jgi:acetyltransferase-like isoleucine patch superfamily enzyme